MGETGGAEQPRERSHGKPGGVAVAHPTLTRSPLIEVVFELRGRGTESFSLMPGRMAALIAHDYPQASETDLAKLAMVAEIATPVEAGLLITHQFRSRDGKRLVQIGPGGVAVNSLAYSGFADFREQTASVLQTYLELAQPQELSRIGLRYINRIDRKTADSFTSGLTCKLDWPTLPGGTPDAFAARMLLEYKDPPGRLGAALQVGPTETTLDLDFYAASNGEPRSDEILGWIDQAHERVYQAFISFVDPAVLRQWK